jgi:hypothetical protein
MKITISLAVLAATFLALPAHARPGPPQADLTREQAQERADALFERFDLNHDGLVTRAEAQRLGTKLMLVRAKTKRDPARGLGGHTLRFLERKFDGVEAVTREQFEGAFLEHFDHMDSNHDGILTAAERQSAR